MGGFALICEYREGQPVKTREGKPSKNPREEPCGSAPAGTQPAPTGKAALGPSKVSAPLPTSTIRRGQLLPKKTRPLR